MSDQYDGPSMAQTIIRLRGENAGLEAWALRVCKVVAEQAEDEGLWSVPIGRLQSITEAYVQQELRRLHEVVECEPPTPGAEGTGMSHQKHIEELAQMHFEDRKFIGEQTAKYRALESWASRAKELISKSVHGDCCKGCRECLADMKEVLAQSPDSVQALSDDEQLHRAMVGHLKNKAEREVMESLYTEISRTVDLSINWTGSDLSTIISGRTLWSLAAAVHAARAGRKG